MVLALVSNPDEVCNRVEPYLRKDGTFLFWGLNDAQFLALMQGFWMADGLHGNASEPPDDGIYIDNTNRKLLDLLQSIGVCRGFRSTIRTNYGNQSCCANAKPMHRLSISKRDDHDMTKYRLQFEAEPFKKEKGLVCQIAQQFHCYAATWIGGDNREHRGVRHPATACGNGSTDWLVADLYAVPGPGTRPLAGCVDGLLTADDRREAIAASTKPNVLVLDFVGNSTKHKLVTAVDVLGGEHSVTLRAGGGHPGGGGGG